MPSSEGIGTLAPVWSRVLASSVSFSFADGFHLGEGSHLPDMLDAQIRYGKAFKLGAYFLVLNLFNAKGFMGYILLLTIIWMVYNTKGGKRTTKVRFPPIYSDDMALWDLK